MLVIFRRNRFIWPWLHNYEKLIFNKSHHMSIKTIIESHLTSSRRFFYYFYFLHPTLNLITLICLKARLITTIVFLYIYRPANVWHVSLALLNFTFVPKHNRYNFINTQLNFWTKNSNCWQYLLLLCYDSWLVKKCPYTTNLK